jgi:hypothetical protein
MGSIFSKRLDPIRFRESGFSKIPGSGFSEDGSETLLVTSQFHRIKT